MSAKSPRSPQAWRIALIISSTAALIWLLTARVLGPSDLWNQTQVKTVSYTTDIIVQGGWHRVLPLERGELPATKPPLYNWIAAPCVKWLGFDSEIAHKLPSVIALLACWLILVRLGNRLDLAHRTQHVIAGSLRDPGRHEPQQSLGWLAGLIFLANPMIFKLGYLARPDMLLTLWLLIAWASATTVFIAKRSGATAGEVAAATESVVQAAVGAAEARPTRWRLLAVAPIVFWSAVTLAALTKGPAAVVVVAYAIIAARIIGGRWSAIRNLHPIVGIVMCLLICSAWVYGVWKINPEHLREELWFNEIYGRVTGTGEEGSDHGHRRWLIELPYQLFYFMTRFAPWSIVAAIGAIAMLRQRTTSGVTGLWMRGAALQVVITIGLYSLSVGKRADYVAGAIPPAALLAAWWLLYGRLSIALRWRWLTPAAAIITLTILTWHNQRETAAPSRGFGDAIRTFAHQANHAVAAQPAPVFTFAAGQTHLQAMLGIVEPDARHAIPDLIRNGKPFWVVAGRTQNPPYEFDRWLAQRRLPADAKSVTRSARLPRREGWPEQVTLWRVMP